MKKTKLIIGISLLCQSLTFFILFCVYWSKKKSLAKTFAAFAAAGGIAGAVLLLSEAKCVKKLPNFDDGSEFDEDFTDLDVCEDDILCSFEQDAENE